LDSAYNSIHGMHQNKPHKKGYHIFRNMVEEGGDLSRESFLRILPPCSQFSGILSSSTADQFHLTDPSDFYSEPDHFLDKRVNAPKLLSGYYGNSDIKKPLMVTMLRDPLERFQSAYYFFLTVDTEFLDSAGINTDQGFDHFTKRTIAQARETGKYNCILWPSLYGKHLNAWLQYTEPSQMMIVPKKLYTDGEGWLHTCQALSSRLDITLSCSPKKAEKITYSNEHPPLSEDITEDTSTQFRNFLHHNDHHKLFDALLQIHHGGGKLFGNHGDGDLPEIKSWLLQHW